MRLAILYTSFRQLRELAYYPSLWQRTPLLRAEVDVVFHNNNRDFSRDQLAAVLRPVGFRHVEIIHSPSQNVGGYAYGQFEAICDAWPRLEAGQYDWVIHLHPDIFIVNECPLLAEIEAADREAADILVCATFGHKAPAYATDFFCFRPSRVPVSVFESYRSLIDTPIVVPLEYLFFNEIFRAGLRRHVATRFRHGMYHRDIDQLGLWHEHDLRRVELFLQSPEARWKTLRRTLVHHPRVTARTVAKWLRRRWRNEPQDSLSAQLTRTDA